MACMNTFILSPWLCPSLVPWHKARGGAVIVKHWLNKSLSATNSRSSSMSRILVSSSSRSISSRIRCPSLCISFFRLGVSTRKRWRWKRWEALLVLIMIAWSPPGIRQLELWIGWMAVSHCHLHRNSGWDRWVLDFQHTRMQRTQNSGWLLLLSG